MEVRLHQKITSFLPSFQICEPKMFVFILLMIVQFFAKNTEGKILIANCFVSSFSVSEIMPQFLSSILDFKLFESMKGVTTFRFGIVHLLKL